MNTRDVTERFRLAQRAAESEALLRASTDALLDPHVLLEAAEDPSGQIVDFVYRDANQATCDYLGLSRADLLGRGVVETMPGIKDTLLPGYIRCLDTGEPVILNDFSYDNEVLADTRRYDLRATRATPTSITLTWRDVTERFQMAQRASEAEARYRRTMDNAAVGMCLTTPDGRFTDVNEALCHFFGYDAATLRQMTWQELTAPEYLDADVANVAKIISGQMDAYRLTKQFIHADGHRIWGDLSVGCQRTPDGDVESFIAQITDTTQEVTLAQQLQRQNELIARAEERYRRSIDNAALGMCLVTPEGRLQEVNEAMCRLFGYDASAMNGTRWQDFTAPEYLEEEQNNFNCILDGRIDSYRMVKHYVHTDGHLIWGDLSVSAVRDEQGKLQNLVALITDITDRVHADERNHLLAQQLQQEKDQLATSERNYRLLAQNAGDVVMRLRDGRVVWVSPSVEVALGGTAAYWLGRHVLEIVPPEDVSVHAALLAKLAEGTVVKEPVRVVAVDGRTHWFHLHAKPFYDDQGHQDGVSAALRPIDDEVATEQALEEARRQQAKSDERHRRSMETAAIGMALLTPDGNFIEVNPALCQIFGYDAKTLTRKTWQELTPPEYLAVGEEERTALSSGRLDSYHIVKQYIHADGHRIWADALANSVRDENGQLETLAFQIRDITAQVEAEERNRILAHQLEQQADLMKSELDSAAAYMSSIMPGNLTGRVAAASRYLPSSGLGGDCFDYSWIDDDHLLVYLIDVSGHGIEPALLSVSVHNMIRSGSLTNETLREPGTVLTELNRLFGMEQQGGHYFTMWCGLYEASTRTLRYACAGAPPALAFNNLTGEAPTMTELSVNSLPIGMFEDTVYAAATYSVPPGCRVLLFSDGAFELEPADGRHFALEDFKNLATRLASSPNGSIDELVEELRALTPAGGFEDDCSLIGLRFN